MTIQKFHDDIQAIQDRLNWRGPIENPVLFYGSSSVRFWERMTEDLRSLGVINAGIGGGTFQSGLYHLDSILPQVTPKQLLVYFGSNDIGACGLSAEETFRDQQQFHAAVRERAPELPIIYLTPVPGPARWIWLEEYRAYNALVEDAVRQDDNTRTLDVMSCLMSTNGLPIGRHFQPDGIHLEPSGYMAWSDVIRAHLCTDQTSP